MSPRQSHAVLLICAICVLEPLERRGGEGEKCFCDVTADRSCAEIPLLQLLTAICQVGILLDDLTRH